MLDVNYSTGCGGVVLAHAWRMNNESWRAFNISHRETTNGRRVELDSGLPTRDSRVRLPRLVMCFPTSWDGNLLRIHSRASERCITQFQAGSSFRSTKSTGAVYEMSEWFGRQDKYTGLCIKNSDSDRGGLTRIQPGDIALVH